MRYTVIGKRQKHWQSEGEEGGLQSRGMESSGSMMKRVIRAEGEGEVVLREAM